MKQFELKTMSLDELVKLFVEVCLAQDRAILNDEHREFKRLFEAMIRVEEEMKTRTGDRRRALVGLFHHPNAQVRLHAAMATLAIEPEAARRVLQSINDRNEYPQAADAHGMLNALDEGRYIPD